MLVDHHYFSKMKQQIVVGISAIFLSACSSLSSDVAGLENVPKLGASHLVAEPTSAPATAMTSFINRVVLGPTNTPKTRRNLTKYVAPKSPVNSSPWCRYLAENAAAETTVLKAPTVSAQINDSGRKSATLAYDVVNIARSNLIEKSAEVKCRRYQASSVLKRTSVVAPNLLTRAGFEAQARSVHHNRGKLQRLKAQIQRELRVGNLDRNEATSLLLKADQIIANGAKASSEAAKREGLLNFDLKDAAEMARQFVKAETDLADLNSDIRSADAVSVNLEGGWRDGLVKNGLTVQDDSLFGAVKVSVKLGAFNPSRKRHERAALAARLKAHRAEPGSIFWKIAELINAHKKARSGLISSKNQLIGARANVRRLKVNLPAHDGTYLAKRISVHIQEIKLNAEIDAVIASIRQLDQNLRKLAYLRANRF